MVVYRLFELLKSLDVTIDFTTENMYSSHENRKWSVPMQISSRFSIAIHMFACMEYFKKDYKITSEFLASSVGVNPVIIRKITSQLRDAGLVNVARGTGGVSIARVPSEITLLDVFNAVDSIEGGKLFSFHENPNANCPVGRNIHLILDDELARVQDAMQRELSAITIADVIKDTEYRIDQAN